MGYCNLKWALIDVAHAALFGWFLTIYRQVIGCLATTQKRKPDGMAVGLSG